MSAINSLSKRLALALVAAFALALGVSAAAQAADVGDFTTIGHRGYHATTTENSLAALDATVQAGGTAMETDVRLTVGGAAVIMHDRTFRRTTHCTGWIHHATLRKVRSYACRLDNGQRVPTASAMLDRARTAGLNLVLEIKRDPLNRWTYSRMSAFKNLIAARGMLGRVRIMSFEPSYTEAAKSLGLYACLVSSTQLAPADVAGGVADSVRLFPEYVTPQVVADFEAVGVTVAGRGSEDPAVWQALLDNGAEESLVSDDVPALVQWVANHRAALDGQPAA